MQILGETYNRVDVSDSEYATISSYMMEISPMPFRRRYSTYIMGNIKYYMINDGNGEFLIYKRKIIDDVLVKEIGDYTDVIRKTEGIDSNIDSKEDEEERYNISGNGSYGEESNGRTSGSLKRFSGRDSSEYIANSDWLEEDEFAIFENLNSTVDSSILEEGLKALKGKAVNTKAINKIASELKTEFASTIDKKEFADMLTRAFGYLHARDNITFNDAMALFSEVARPVIDSAIKVENADLYNEFTDYFRGKKNQIKRRHLRTSHHTERT